MRGGHFRALGAAGKAGEMSKAIRIGTIIDFRPGLAVQQAHKDALKHAADYLCLTVESHWVPTAALLEPEGQAELASFDGICTGPGNPEVRQGALLAVQYAREHDRPMLST